MHRRMLKIPIKYRSISETFQLFNILQVDKFWNNRPIIFGVFKAFAFSDQRYSIYRENRVTDSLFRRKTPAPSRSALSNGRDDERSRQEWRILFRELSFGGFETVSSKGAALQVVKQNDNYLVLVKTFEHQSKLDTGIQYFAFLAVLVFLYKLSCLASFNVCS